MSDSLYTFWFYFPNSKGNPLFSTIAVHSDDLVATMRRAIWDELKFHGVTPLIDFKIFKTEIEIDPKETLLERSLQWLHSIPLKTVLDPIDFIKTYFPSSPRPPIDRIISLIIATEETLLEGLDILSDPLVIQMKKWRRAREEQLSHIRKAPAPSEIVKSASMIASLFGGKNSFIHMGRPSGNYGPPTVLFHPTLAKLKKYLDQPEEVQVSYTDIMLSRVYFDFSTDVYKDESVLEVVLREVIDSIIGVPGRWQKETEFHTAKPGARWTQGDFDYLICEIKNEPGFGDPSLQAILSFAKVLAQPKYKKYLYFAKLPIILVGIAGNRLEILTAIFTDSIYVDKLLSIDINDGLHTSDKIVQLARIFKALALCAKELRAHYSQLTVAFPSITLSYLLPDPTPASDNVSMPTLTFQRKMGRSGHPLSGIVESADRPSGLYIATLTLDTTTSPTGKTSTSPGPSTIAASSSAVPTEREVIVKFTSHYNDNAHRILAANGLAPTLYACFRVVGGLNMVVMDRIDARSISHISGKFPYGVYRDVKKAVELLHAEDIVFGDLREPNILFNPSTQKAMLVDFDWAGKHQNDMYSASLNDAIDWPTGVYPWAKLDKAHDLEFLARLEKDCETV